MGESGGNDRCRCVTCSWVTKDVSSTMGESGGNGRRCRCYL